ncbi:hypothetical protein QBC40DRAFT_24617 [Triangularia verruculosa]|uniref:Uncharacterized protein n=1 Tax=Triangularia verruculosa TaxID=2587418 RepID=A0AAN7AQT7_9PEZI|nr:hypothetical protein QBC40DRAFT_24617 [Triangularia verruculosa]
MAFPRHHSSRISDVQLPIMLIADDDDFRDMESDLELDSRGRPEEKPRPGPPMPASSATSSAPQHPIPSMQDAFAESLVEATQGENSGKPKLRTGDAKARREELLDGEHSDPHPAALWRFRPGQQAHELWRLMAQISFGVYLLLKGMANSQILVVSILQGHIDEVDEFLETTLEDMDLAMKDVKLRIEHLKLPMDNIDVFERMLEDQNYRMTILEGNEKIEHILARTQVALKQTTQDLAEGLAATRDFTIYLAEQHHGPWRQERPDVIDIFDAMKGNTDGWFNAFMDLQHKGSALNALVVRLAGMVSEMDRRAGEVSRRVRSQQLSAASHTSPKHSPKPSDASATTATTPPTSPPRKIPNSPPRLSLRLSTINALAASRPSSFLNFSFPEETEPTAENKAPTPQQVEVPTPIQEEPETKAAPLSPPRSLPQSSPPQSPLQLLTSAVYQPPPRSKPSKSPQPPAESPPESPPPPARNPRRLSERPSVLLEAPKLEVHKEEEEPKEETLYLLQPTVYTPQPSPRPSPRPSPQPSPRIVAERPKPRENVPSAKLEFPSPAESIPKPRTASPKPRGQGHKAQTSRTQIVEAPRPKIIENPRPKVVEIPKPKVVEIRGPKVVEIGTRNRAPALRRDLLPDSRYEPRPTSTRTDSFKTTSTGTDSFKTDSLGSDSMRTESLRDPGNAPEVVPSDDLEVDLYPTNHNRTSLRDRISLKMNPPESIHVPPPDHHTVIHHHPSPSTRTYNHNQQQPHHHYPHQQQPYQTFQPPDSAYGSGSSDMERPPGVNSLASYTSSDFSPPPSFIAPGLIPSPHSDRQFFRPVQANPYSPLQQRPHTSGTVGRAVQQFNFPIPPIPSRNIPSAMGMSVMSAATMDTTTTKGGSSSGGGGLKKKRSAFGWLKKAFSLDEEERAAFEQRRRELDGAAAYAQQQQQGQNSPKFLDGRRIDRPGVMPGNRSGYAPSGYAPSQYSRQGY